MSVFNVIKKRRSVRAYKDTDIPGPVMEKLMDSLRLAPSACNNQPWRFILVTDPDLKVSVARAAKNQDWMARAPVIVVGCAVMPEAYKGMGGEGSSADVDVAIAIDHLTLAAAEEGLGTCWIGAFSETEVKTMLKIPDTVKVVAMTPVGYPASDGALHDVPADRRKKSAEVFFENTWQE